MKELWAEYNSFDVSLHFSGGGVQGFLAGNGFKMASWHHVSVCTGISRWADYTALP
jgi:hypothetical protein